MFKRSGKWHYIDLLEGVIRVSDLTQVFLQTLLIAAGMPLILAGLMFVEYHGVQSGAALFLLPDSASIIALVFVTSNMVIELMIVHREYASGYKRPASEAWSLRHVFRSAGYRLGVGRHWTARPQSPASSFIAIRTGITVAIFLLAFSGRMESAIEKVSALPAIQGVESLATVSTLKDVLIWLGGTTMTMVAIFAARNLTHHIGQRVIEIKDELKRLSANRKAQQTRTLNRNNGTVPIHSNGTERNGTDSRPALGHSKNTNAWNLAVEYFESNPDALKRDGREIAAELGIGKSTVYKARSEFQQRNLSNGNGSANGHETERFGG